MFAGPPDAPHLSTPSLNVTNGTVRAVVKWTVPFDGNSPIDFYTVYFRSSGEDMWSSHAVDGSQHSTVIALHGIETMEFCVSATNIRNSSKRSNVRQVNEIELQLLMLVLLPVFNKTDVADVATSTPGKLAHASVLN